MGPKGDSSCDTVVATVLTHIVSTQLALTLIMSSSLSMTPAHVEDIYSTSLCHKWKKNCKYKDSPKELPYIEQILKKHGVPVSI